MHVELARARHQLPDSHAARRPTRRTAPRSTSPPPGRRARCGWCGRTPSGRRGPTARARGRARARRPSAHRVQLDVLAGGEVHPATRERACRDRRCTAACARSSTPPATRSRTMKRSSCALRAHAVGLEPVVVVGRERLGSGRAHRRRGRGRVPRAWRGGCWDGSCVGASDRHLQSPSTLVRRQLAVAGAGGDRREHRDHCEHREAGGEACRWHRPAQPKPDTRRKPPTPPAAPTRPGDRADAGGVAPADELEHGAVADAERTRPGRRARRPSAPAPAWWRAAPASPAMRAERDRRARWCRRSGRPARRRPVAAAIPPTRTAPRTPPRSPATRPKRSTKKMGR